AEEYDFDAALQRRAIGEQAGQWRACPAHVANRPHESRAQAVAAAFQSRRDCLAFASFDLGEGQLRRLPHQARNLEPMLISIERWGVVVANDVKVFTPGE